ncbi:MAG: RND transporter, partial [Pseudomonas alloputida]
MTLPRHLCLLPLSLSLLACSTPTPPTTGITPPAGWQSSTASNAQALRDQRWWQAFASPELDQLIEIARNNSHDLAAAAARVR